MLALILETSAQGPTRLERPPIVLESLRPAPGLGPLTNPRLVRLWPAVTHPRVGLGPTC